MGHLFNLRAELSVSTGATPSYSIKPTKDNEVYEIRNILGDGDGTHSLVLAITDGTNTSTLQTITADALFSGMPLFSDINTYVTVTNGDTATAVVWVQGIAHNKQDMRSH